VITSGTAVLGESLTYTAAPDFAIDDTAGGNALVVRADNRRRPLIRIAPAAAWTFTGHRGADQRASALVLDGVFVSGGDLVIAGAFASVTLSTTTLDPGEQGGTAADGRALVPSRLRIRGEVQQLTIDRSIVGPIVVEPGGLVETVTIRDSIVQAVEPGELALAIDRGMTNLAACTILGAARLHQIEATTSIFCGAVTIADHQHGCVRFSALPDGSIVPRRYECVAIAGDQPLFTSRSFGQPGYGQLLASAVAGVASGAENGSELGAFWRDGNAIKANSLLLKYQEYMPIGLAPVLIFVT
jgi:hypothetical protein